MPKQNYRKLDIAYEYLSVACELYFQERYFPALHLAGAAEEILHAVMEKRNERIAPGRVGPQLVPEAFRPVSDERVALAKVINPLLRNKSDGHVAWLLNRAKNAAKHGTGINRKGFELSLTVDAELEAWSMLGRALENFIRLHYVPEGAIKRFWLHYLEGRKTWHHNGSSEGPHAKPHSLRKPLGPDE